MGLDMYLYAKRYVSCYGNNCESDSISCPESILPKGYKINYITTEAFYWRKANWFHKWFVEKVQAGVDDCGEYDVPIETIKELLETIDKVLDNNLLRLTLLPVQEGFFFGSNSYDDLYIESLKETKEGLTKMLNTFGDEWVFTYHSSW